MFSFHADSQTIMKFPVVQMIPSELVVHVGGLFVPQMKSYKTILCIRWKNAEIPTYLLFSSPVTCSVCLSQDVCSFMSVCSPTQPGEVSLRWKTSCLVLVPKMCFGYKGFSCSEPFKGKNKTSFCLQPRVNLEFNLN